MNPRGQAVEHIVRLALRLPAADAQKTSAALLLGLSGLQVHRATCGSVMVRSFCDQLEKSTPLLSTSEMVGVIDGAVRAAAAVRTPIEVVWTGPEVPTSATRLTASVVAGLIDGTAESLLLINYAVFSPPLVEKALRSAAERGVQITLIYERPADNPKFAGVDLPFPGLHAFRYHWPPAAREASASLHAKVLVSDRSKSLVGSANLTGSAFERNLECGLFVRDGKTSDSIWRHVEALVESKVLRRTN